MTKKYGIFEKKQNVSYFIAYLKKKWNVWKGTYVNKIKYSGKWSEFNINCFHLLRTGENKLYFKYFFLSASKRLYFIYIFSEYFTDIIFKYTFIGVFLRDCILNTFFGVFQRDYILNTLFSECFAQIILKYIFSGFF